jgi:RNA polymerase sigma-70 factor (ECF subfamily)
LSADDALDVVQDAFYGFLMMPVARKVAMNPEDAGALLVVLTRNLARNRRRRHDRARRHDPLGDLPTDDIPVDELIDAAEKHAAAVGCAYHLSEVQRRVVTLRLLDEVPGEEVAASFGFKPGNVAVLLHRAKEQLRTCMLEAGYSD